MQPLCRFLIATVLLTCAACGQDVGPLPKPAPLFVEGGFPFDPAPPCSAAADVAFQMERTTDILRAARAGTSFSCSHDEFPLILLAVGKGDVELVAALLEAGADPNVRWSPSGDSFPLQEAQSRLNAGANYPQAKIIALLLAHGADPNMRGCPWASSGRPWPRGPRIVMGCAAPEGVLPLTHATFNDDIPVMRMLLDAGADPTLADSLGGSALCAAHSEAAVSLLLPKMYPGRASAEQAALKQLETCRDPTLPDGPWTETVLTRTIVTWTMHSLERTDPSSLRLYLDSGAASAANGAVREIGRAHV
jgi:hypothetical protein